MSKKFEEIKKYFDLGFWTVQKVKNAVRKSWITAEEFKIITGEDYSN